jgi:hypothetical protein
MSRRRVFTPIAENFVRSLSNGGEIVFLNDRRLRQYLAATNALDGRIIGART